MRTLLQQLIVAVFFVPMHVAFLLPSATTTKILLIVHKQKPIATITSSPLSRSNLSIKISSSILRGTANQDKANHDNDETNNNNSSHTANANNDDNQNQPEKDTIRVRIWQALASGEELSMTQLSKRVGERNRGTLKSHLAHVERQAKTIRNKSNEWRVRRGLTPIIEDGGGGGGVKRLRLKIRKGAKNEVFIRLY